VPPAAALSRSSILDPVHLNFAVLVQHDDFGHAARCVLDENHRVNAALLKKDGGCERNELGSRCGIVSAVEPLIANEDAVTHFRSEAIRVDLHEAGPRRGARRERPEVARAQALRLNTNHPRFGARLKSKELYLGFLLYTIVNCTGALYFSLCEAARFDAENACAICFGLKRWYSRSSDAIFANARMS
jgi:hypothetical protein